MTYCFATITFRSSGRSGCEGAEFAAFQLGAEMGIDDDAIEGVFATPGLMGTVEDVEGWRYEGWVGGRGHCWKGAG